MREVQASEAETRLPRSLDEVEHGQTIVITRHGAPITRLVPEAATRRQAVDKAIESIMVWRQRTSKVTRQEIPDARHAGHRF